MTHNGATFRRNAAAAALGATPLLHVVSSALAPSFDGDQATRLAAMNGALPTISALAFLLAQLPTMIVFLAIGHLLRASYPRLALWGTCLGVAGAFAHTVFAGISLVELLMAADQPHRAVYAELLTYANSGPIMLFGLLGLVGTVIGTLLVSIGLWHAHLGPRWMAPLLWAFLIVEFALTNVSPYAAYLSPLLLLAAFGALAVEIRRQPSSLWAARMSPAPQQKTMA